MNLFLYLTNFIVPFLILAIIVYGLLMKINVYEHFIKGARNGFLTVLKIMPTLIGLMVAVGILRASGFLEMISSCIGQFTAAIGFPGELVPLTVVKMFSSSARRKTRILHLHFTLLYWKQLKIIPIKSDRM